MLVHDGVDVLRLVDFLAVDGHDEVAAQHDGGVPHVSLLVAAAQAGSLRGAAWNYLLNQNSVIRGKAHLRGQIGTDGVIDDAQRGPLDASIAGQVGQYGLRRVDGNGKTDTGALVGAVGGDHGVDADDLAVRVQQRAAGVAGVDGRVGLDGVLDGRALRTSNGADGADDAAGHGAAEAKGIADGVDLLAHGECGGVGQRDGLQVGRVDLQQGQVVRPVGAHNLGRVAALVAQHHLDAAVGALHHVVVGQHVTALVEDESGTLALLRHRPVKEVEDQGGGSDVHHRGQHSFVDGNIVLLFGVVGGRGLSLGQLERGA